MHSPIHVRAAPPLASTIGAILAVSLVLPAPAQDVPFETLARDLLRRAGQEDANPDTFAVNDFLTANYVRARLGLFEVYLSRSSAQDATNATNYARMLTALLDLQDAWLDWLAPASEVGAAKADVKELRKWANGLRGAEISTTARERAGELMELLHARDATVEAAGRLARVMGTGALLGLERSDRPEPIVLAPTRIDFLEHAGLAGWIYPELRDTYWNQELTSWTQIYMDDVSVYALEYAQAGVVDWRLGTAMDEQADDGMAQQVTQLAAVALLDGYYGERIPPSLAGALSVNLTIDVFSECSTRVDGDLRSRRTEAYEVFIPGGASEGGWLPAIAADSRWRQDQGKDHFVAVLRLNQKAGAKEARREGGGVRHFMIQNDDGTARRAVSAPFLGQAAADAAELPSDFRGDHLEFLRAYRTCFLHWLRERSCGKAADSELAFARFLHRIFGDEDVDLEQVMAETFVHGALSQDELPPESLEGHFLQWLSKQ